MKFLKRKFFPLWAEIITEEFFYVSSGAILVFSILEWWRPQIVLAYFNLNILFTLWLFGAIILIIKPKS